MSKEKKLTIVPKGTTAINPRTLQLGVFADPGNFNHWQRMAKTLSASSLVPEVFRGEKNVGNCLIALNMANRAEIDPFLLMQNMDMIKGKPTLSAKFVIAQINTSGKFSAIRFEFENRGTKELEFGYKDNQGQYKKTKRNFDIIACRAKAKDLKTNEELLGGWVDMEMAVKEGWYSKKGSKWQTMPEQMMRYRAVGFWANIYFPEGKLGMKTTDEQFDSLEPVVLTQEADTIATLNEVEDVTPVKKEVIVLEPKAATNEEAIPTNTETTDKDQPGDSQPEPTDAKEGTKEESEELI